MLEKTEKEIENRQSRQTDNIAYTRRRQTKQKTQDNICCTPLYATNTNYVNKT